jgi:hypothetical protein
MITFNCLSVDLLTAEGMVIPGLGFGNSPVELFWPIKDKRYINKYVILGSFVNLKYLGTTNRHITRYGGWANVSTEEDPGASRWSRRKWKSS